MARPMAALDRKFIAHCDSALGLAQAGEIAHATSPVGSAARTELTEERLELLYEMAFLRTFCAWETFLEESLLRYMCGHESQYGQAKHAGRSFCASVTAARKLLYGNNRQWLLWANVDRVKSECAQVISAGRHEHVFAAYEVPLKAIGVVRNRIAHDNEDAKKKFVDASLELTGFRFRKRPGEMLRDWDRTILPRGPDAPPAVRHIHTIVGQLKRFAALIM